MFFPWDNASLGILFNAFMPFCAGIMAAILCELLASISGEEQIQYCDQ
jgi:hypothetical protein